MIITLRLENIPISKYYLYANYFQIGITIPLLGDWYQVKAISYNPLEIILENSQMQILHDE